MNNKKEFLILVCIFVIAFFSSFLALSTNDLSNMVALSLSFFFALLCVLVYVLIKISQREKEEVSKASYKIQNIRNLNETIGFKPIMKKWHEITEREYSRKSLDRVTGASIIKYHIENDTDHLRTDIENALYNISLLDDYTLKVNEILAHESENKTNYSTEKYQKIENEILKSLIHKKEDFLICMKCTAYYRSNGGKVHDTRRGKFSFDDLTVLYNEWQNGQKYTETKKQERKIMNDDIRYNVLKRDNYTCQICGATAKDGAKLHVDHIIPVSKGGKTVMSNLQTLCDRCNLGKSNKMDSDFEGNMICPFCGGKLVEQKGKYGMFIGCSNYPKCHYNRPLNSSTDSKNNI